MNILEGLNESELWVLYGNSFSYYPFPDRERLRIARMVSNSSFGSFRADPIMAGFNDFVGLESFTEDYSTPQELRELVYKDSQELHRNIITMDRLTEKHGFKASSINGIYSEMNNAELIDHLSKVYKRQHNEVLSENIKKKALKYLDFMFLRSRVIPLLLIPGYELNLDDRCHTHVKDFYHQIIKENDVCK